MATSAGSVVVKVIADTTELEQAIRRVSRQIRLVRIYEAAPTLIALYAIAVTIALIVILATWH